MENFIYTPKGKIVINFLIEELNNEEVAVEFVYGFSSYCV